MHLKLKKISEVVVFSAPEALALFKRMLKAEWNGFFLLLVFMREQWKVENMQYSRQSYSYLTGT